MLFESPDKLKRNSILSAVLLVSLGTGKKIGKLPGLAADADDLRELTDCLFGKTSIRLITASVMADADQLIG